MPLSDLVTQQLAADGDTRTIVVDPSAGDVGAVVDDSTSTPGPDATLGSTTFAGWFAAAAAPAPG